MASKKKYGFAPAISVVVANMVGTGVFTTLGFQLLDIHSAFAILLLWAIGGLIAFCGAISYAELGAALPRSGGEYHFIGRIYHPAAGFLSGWVSATVGFAAPVSLAAMTFSAYLLSSTIGGDPAPGLQKAVACGAVGILAVIHSSRRAASGGFQTALTVLKILVILSFCCAVALLAEEPPSALFAPQQGTGDLLFSGAFAIGLIYVSYAYAGWNSAAYIIGEIENPVRNLPKIFAIGSLMVAVLYVALNAAFLAAAPAEALAGKIEIGFVAAQYAFGETAARFTGIVLAVLLISTISAMTIAGPRVLQAIGEDYRAFHVLSAANRDGLPVRAILFQAALSILFILTSTFQSVLIFASFLVALNSLATVIGLFVLRLREPSLGRPYKAFGYPVTPLIYIALNGWTLIFVAATKPQQALAALLLIFVGLCIYAAAKFYGERG